MNVIIETKKWQPIEMLSFAESLRPCTIPGSRYKSITGFQYNKGCYNHIQSDKVNLLMPSSLASPLSLEIVLAANEPVSQSMN